MKQEKQYKSEIDVECKLCKAKYAVDRDDFLFSLKHNDGWFPCVVCGSRATKWDLDGAE